MPLQSTLATSGSEESETATPDKHKSTRMKTGWAYPAQKIGLSDDLCRIVNIAFNTNPVLSSETSAYFSGADDDVQVINSPNPASHDLRNTVLLKAEEARPFEAHIVPVTGSIRVRDGYGKWHKISISGRMFANLWIKDKHCWSKRVHPVNKDMENVEFWILDQGAETFPHESFVNRTFTVAHKLDKPNAGALKLHRGSLYKSLPEIADDETVNNAMKHQRAMVAADAAMQECLRGS
ncbi:uncharacterized protein LTHEOB_11085 [Lasiodiplodia theobromae]|uniref:uncharacterized protein n=1 Tax=Lasiodiplodia theobromae TaxID=45133 RepID=UPI0015C3774B|nr:uncharacterized protein LTHEOB_11085 [Lasiodiplodia theobromae]KAF4538137.1 hypothetical protein LTHEOB_11085 [Lasiodiplodia theobromae]